jgi:hypothetical protein
MNIKRKNKPKTITMTVAVSEKEKNLFTEIARKIDVPHNLLVRHLIRYFLDGKRSWDELFGEQVVLPAPYTLDGSEKKGQRLRTKVEVEQYATFMRRVDERGSTAGIVLRRLMLLYAAGKIAPEDIWR